MTNPPWRQLTRARPEDSGRQEARARTLSQSSYGAQFNTARKCQMTTKLNGIEATH
jgi:hypothetical protein